ncbi:MAG: ELM1/GtrOC1 family putative glycosyltransferase [Pseudomonadota bacterium]
MTAPETARPLRVLILADEKPGHYHQSEGVVRALSRVTSVASRRVIVERRAWAPRILLRTMHRRNASAQAILSTGYGLGPADLEAPDIVVSSGGETVFATIAAAQLTGARSIYLGTIGDDLSAEFDLVIASQAGADAPGNHARLLQPNAIDPDQFSSILRSGPAGGRTAAVLIGGNTRHIRYSVSDWEALAGFMQVMHRETGLRFVVATSRRTRPDVIAALSPVVHDRAVTRQFLDYRMAGPSALPPALAVSSLAFVTADSSAMLSEAIAARLPTIAISGSDHWLDAGETRYREFLSAQGWTRSLAMAGLAPQTCAEALRQITPRSDNHLDELANMLRVRFATLLRPHTGTN